MPDAFAGIFMDFMLSVDDGRIGWAERILATGLRIGDGGRVVEVYVAVGEGVRVAEGELGGACAREWEMPLAVRARSAARAASLAHRTVFVRVGGGGGITGAGERGMLEGAPEADEHLVVGSWRTSCSAARRLTCRSSSVISWQSIYREVRLSAPSWLLGPASPRRSRRAAWRVETLGDAEQLAMWTSMRLRGTDLAAGSASYLSRDEPERLRLLLIGIGFAERLRRPSSSLSGISSLSARNVSGIASVSATGETGETWNMFSSEPMSILSVLLGSGRCSARSSTTTMSSC